MGRNRGSDGACEPHVSLTHEPELNGDWKAGRRRGRGNVLHVLPAGQQCSRRGCVSLGGQHECGSLVLLCSSLPRYGGAAPEAGGVVGGSRVHPENTAEHVFPAERQRVPRSCRVTLQSAGHGCALEGICRREGGRGGGCLPLLLSW